MIAPQWPLSRALSASQPSDDLFQPAETKPAPGRPGMPSRRGLSALNLMHSNWRVTNAACDAFQPLMAAGWHAGDKSVASRRLLLS